MARNFNFVIGSTGNDRSSVLTRRVKKRGKLVSADYLIEKSTKFGTKYLLLSGNSSGNIKLW